ncbi:MAG: DMT family transporter [Fusobacteriaceae bacterium]
MLFKGYLFAVFAGISWGFLGLYGIKLNDLGFNSNEIAFSRMLFGFLVGFIYLLSDKDKRKKLQIKKMSLKYILVIWVITQGLLNVLFYASVLKIGTVTATMLLCSGPIFTVILSVIFLKEEFSNEKKIALLIAIFGALLLITEGKISNLNLNSLGLLLGLGSGLCYGLYPILGKKCGNSDDSMTSTIFAFLAAAIFLIPTIELKEFFIKIANFKTFTLLLSFGLIPTVMSYIFFLNSLKYIPVSLASIISLIEVPSATLLGIIFLSEDFNIYKFLGLILVFAGVSITKVKLNIFRKNRFIMQNR